jgi:hypothetical protein
MPIIDAFTEHRQIVVGYIEPVGAMAIASEGCQTLAMLRRRKDETFKQLLASLDTAIASTTIERGCGMRTCCHFSTRSVQPS